jgi:Ca2+-dependent lipid-binding protein
MENVKELIDLIFTDFRDLPPKDVNGLCDPYFVASLEENSGSFEELKHSSPIFVSNVLEKTINPTFDHHVSFFFQGKANHHIYINIYDHDNVTKDDYIGKNKKLIKIFNRYSKKIQIYKKVSSRSLWINSKK